HGCHGLHTFFQCWRGAHGSLAFKRKPRPKERSGPADGNTSSYRREGLIHPALGRIGNVQQGKAGSSGPMSKLETWARVLLAEEGTCVLRKREAAAEKTTSLSFLEKHTVHNL
ncbi:hypothetical protein VIGAN_07142500, partial [Vigna angularis var. angularis]